MENRNSLQTKGDSRDGSVFTRLILSGSAYCVGGSEHPPVFPTQRSLELDVARSVLDAENETSLSVHVNLTPRSLSR